MAHALLRAACTENTSEEDIVKITDTFLQNHYDKSSFSGVQGMLELGDELASRIQTKTENYTKTGFPKLDKFFYGGLPPGSLVILAGRPGTGKTSIGCYMMKSAAENGTKVVMFSLEQTNLEIYQKLMTSTGLITHKELLDASPDWREYEKGICILSQLPILLDESSRSVEEIAYRIAALRRQNKCDAAYIDYLGLIPTQQLNGITKSQAIGEITHRLKSLAKDLKIPIILFCQLNRDMAKANRAPVLTDLRDSGDIEQDADKVIMIHRLEQSENNYDSCIEIELWIRKNRQGRAGEIKLRLQPDETYTRFNEVE